MTELLLAFLQQCWSVGCRRPSDVFLWISPGLTNLRARASFVGVGWFFRPCHLGVHKRTIPEAWRSKIQSFLKLLKLLFSSQWYSGKPLVFSLTRLHFQILVAVCIRGFTYHQISVCCLFRCACIAIIPSRVHSVLLQCLTGNSPHPLVRQWWAAVACHAPCLWEQSLVCCLQSPSCDGKYVCLPSLTPQQNESWTFLSY